MSDSERYEKRMAREKSARKQAEHLLEEKSRALFEKQLELEALSQSLEKLVAQRTIQMQKARDDALYALQVKSDFIANMSHELRTPMNGVLGVMSLLSEEDLNESQANLVKVAVSSGQHLLGVINDILDFSKMEANKIELVYAPVAVHEYFKMVCAPFALQIKAKSIDLELELSPDLPAVLMIDELRLTQIISNLLSNAIKFTEHGKVLLHFKPYNDGYRLSVTDTGIGISPQNIKNVFATFEQADTSITRKFGGTGLGMSITKQLVEMFGGEISISSVMGEGTTFFIDLKLEQAEQTDIETSELKAFDIEQLGAAKILLVEDNKVNQLIGEKMLSTWDCQVDIAENGQMALDMLAANEKSPEAYSLILMDLQMPIMGGIEAARQIRKSTCNYSTIPIIAMTAHTSQEHIEECLAVGMNDHISKPIDKALLQVKVAEYCQLGQLACLEIEGENAGDSADSSAALPKGLHIDGIDLQTGLARINNDWGLYYSLLSRFIDENESLSSRFRLAFNNDDKDAASMEVHRIKGGAGNLGAMDIAKLAADIETKLIVNKTWPAPSELDLLLAKLDSLKAKWALVDNPHKTQKEIVLRDVSETFIKAQMQDISALINKDLLTAETLLNDLLSCNLPESILESLHDAQSAMERFDTKSVSQCVDLAMTRLG